jgi:hypothetical protein
MVLSLLIGVSLLAPSRGILVAPDDLGQKLGPEPVRTLIERFNADQDTLSHRYNQPYLEGDIARRERLYTETEGALHALPFEKLDREGQVDYLLLQSRLRERETSEKIQLDRLKELSALVPFRQELLALEVARRDLAPLEYDKVANQLVTLTSEITKSKSALAQDDQKGIDPVKALRAARVVDSLNQAIGDWYRFYNGYDPQFSFWMPTPYQALSAELSAYATALRKKAGDDPSNPERMIGLPAGREQLVSDLAAAYIDYTPEELLAVADKEYAWCLNEMKAASKDLGFGDNWKAALEKVKDDHVPAGSQPALVRGFALEAIDYLRKNDLVTVPELTAEAFTLQMMSPNTQLFTPFFYFDEGISGIAVAYPTPEMDLAAKTMAVRGNNVHFARATVFHELIPGHWLQFYSSARNHPYRQSFETPFWHEGNSLYWEMNFYDRKFYRNPMDRIGMLFWRMHRCARIVFSLKYQLGEWTPQQCVDYLVDKVGHERKNAEGEVRRTVSGGYSPLYQAAYMVGGLEFRARRHDLVDTHKMTERAFNDAVLAEGCMPIELLRALLVPSVKLTPDYKTNWRFYTLP